MGKNDTKNNLSTNKLLEDHIKMSITEEDSKKCFLEFNLELVLHTNYLDRESKINEINSLITQVLGKEDAIHMSAHVSVISEDNMVFPAQTTGTRFEN